MRQTMQAGSFFPGVLSCAGGVGVMGLPGAPLGLPTPSTALVGVGVLARVGSFPPPPHPPKMALNRNKTCHSLQRGSQAPL